MNFLHPGLLAAGLACVAIPILIHLLMNRRRRPVRWAAMRFLLEAYRRQQRRLLIEKWLLLATRCLIFALLAAALARPVVGSFFGPVGGGAPRTVYLLIDNSLTARLERGEEQALERHKRTAREVLTAVADARPGAVGSGGAARVSVVTLASPAEGLVTPASADFEAVARLIDELTSTDARADLAGALSIVAEQSRADRAAAGSSAVPPPMVVVISDLREGVFDATDSAALSAAMTAGSLPVGTRVLVSTDGSPADAANTAVVSVEPLRPIFFAGGGTSAAQVVAQQVRVALARSGGGTDATTVRLRLSAAGAVEGDGPSGSAVVRWNAGQQSAEAVVTVAGEMTVGQSGAVLRARIDDDSLDADNWFVRPVEVRQALRVGILAPRRFEARVRADRLDASQWLRLALTAAGEASTSAAGGVEVVEIDPAAVDAARLSALDAIMVTRPDLVADASWSRLRLFVESGGLLMVFPPSAATTHLWPDQLSQTLGLPLSAPREAVVVGASGGGEQGASLRLAVSGARGGAEDGGGSAGDSAGLLNIIAGELPELLRPVRVFRHLPPQAGGADLDAFRRGVLMTLEDGTAVLWASAMRADAGQAPAAAGNGGERAGMVIYCSLAMDPAWTDLPARPLMVPLMQELVRQGVGAARPPTVFAAGVFPLAAPLPRRSVELVQIAGASSAGAGDRSAGRGGSRAGLDAAGLGARIMVDPLTGAARTPMRHAGLFRAIDDAGAVTAVVGVNPDTRGSRVGVQSEDAVAAALARTLDPSDGVGAEGAGGVLAVTFFGPGDRAGAVGAAERDRPDAATAVRSVFGQRAEDSALALRLLIAALVLAVAEVGLARRASHASVTGGTSETVGDVLRGERGVAA